MTEISGFRCHVDPTSSFILIFDLLDTRQTMDRWPESTAEVQLDSPKSEQNGLEDIGRDLEDQVVLILVGLPGSSKSTFSNALVNHSQSSTWSTSSRHAKHTESLEPERTSRKRRLWSRVSQDEAPNRRRQECEAALREALYRGENVIVDRVNFDPSYVSSLPPSPLFSSSSVLACFAQSSTDMTREIEMERG